MFHVMKKAGARKRTFATVLGAAALTLSVVFAGSDPASARTICLKRDEMTSKLEKHKESQVAIGLASNGNLIEVFSTGDGATWSIVMTDTRGNSCLVAAGKDWDARNEILLGQAT